MTTLRIPGRHLWAAGPYYILKDSGGHMRAGILQQSSKPPLPSHWSPYLHVADCDAAARKAMALGAIKTVEPPTDIPNIGRFAILIDPLGAIIAVMTGASQVIRNRRYKRPSARAKPSA